MESDQLDYLAVLQDERTRSATTSECPPDRQDTWRPDSMVQCYRLVSVPCMLLNARSPLQSPGPANPLGKAAHLV